MWSRSEEPATGGRSSERKAPAVVPAASGPTTTLSGSSARSRTDDLNALGELGRFTGGAKVDKRLIAILIALTSEAARFATVATYFVGLTNSVGTEYPPYLPKSVDFEYLKRTYFTQWANPPQVDMQPGQVYHFVRPGGEILLPHKRS